MDWYAEALKALSKLNGKDFTNATPSGDVTASRLVTIAVKARWTDRR